MNKKTIATILAEMIEYSEGNVHDINHLLKVWSYAKTIGELENLDTSTQFILEVAAIVHDIACPLCREKYGNTNGKYQEIEGIPLTEAFLQDSGMSAQEIARVAYLVGHHHTMDQVDGMDYQILLEADYLVNADEAGYSLQNIKKMRDSFFKTASGIGLLNSIYFKDN